MNIFLVLLIFGNVTDVFTNRTFDLCRFNFTLFDGLCPPGVQLTPENFASEYTYVFNLLLFKIDLIYLENVTCHH
jgi:hypothetical protein